MFKKRFLLKEFEKFCMTALKLCMDNEDCETVMVTFENSTINLDFEEYDDGDYEC